MPATFVTCRLCKGTGKTKLSGPLADTLLMVPKKGWTPTKKMFEAFAILDARGQQISAEGFVNRLNYLHKRGLIRRKEPAGPMHFWQRI